LSLWSLSATIPGSACRTPSPQAGRLRPLRN
jgi:hypothetical protein